MNYIVSHDIGTTGVKSCLFDERLGLQADRYRGHKTFYKEPLTALQKPDDWWLSIVASTRELLEETGISPSSVAGICVDGHMNGCIPVDRDGNLLMDETFLWADFRSTEEAAFLESEIGFKRFYQITGGGLDLPIYPASKILWIKKNRKDLYDKTYAFLGTKDFINLRLTGCFATDFSEGSNYGLMDLQKGKWSEEIVGSLGLDMEKLPLLIDSCEIVGRLTEKAASDCGLIPGIPVVTGGGDVPCASVGAGSVEENTPYLSLGSASWISDTVPKNALKLNPSARPFVLNHVVKDYYCSQLVNYGGGICYQWIIDLLVESSCDSSFEKNRENLYSAFEQWSVGNPKKSRDLIFLPYLRGGGPPDYNERARGAFIGLSMEHGAYEMIKAVQEGVAYNLRGMLSILFGRDSPSADLRIIGGGAQSDAWCGTIADICGCSIVRPKTLQMATARGAAAVCGVGLGILDDFSSANESMGTPDCFEPNRGSAIYHDKMYEIFQGLLESMNPYYDRFSDSGEKE